MADPSVTTFTGRVRGIESGRVWFQLDQREDVDFHSGLVDFPAKYFVEYPLVGNRVEVVIKVERGE